MSCTKCNEQDPCVQVDCTCQVKISTDCVTYTGDDLPCSGIKKGVILTELIQQLDAFICEKFAFLAAYFRLKNIGNGSKIYAGDNNIGEKQLRTLTKTGDLLLISTPAPTDTEINFTIDEDELIDFVQTNQKTITSDDGSIIITETATNIDLSVLTIEDGIPRFIVNSAYTGVDELGTISQPFKNIPNAVTAFLTGGVPATILIQKGNGYNYTGHFNYDGLTVELESNTGIFSNPTADWLCDLDSIGAGIKTEVNFILGEGSVINLVKNGFRNRGTNINNSAFTTYKKISIKGKGQIIQSIADDTDPDRFVIFESNFANTAGFYNDSVTPFEVSGVRINPQTQGIMKMGGFTYSNFLDVQFAVSNPGVSVNSGLVPFRINGGTVGISNCNIGVLVSGLVLFSFNPSAGVTCLLNLSSNDIVGNLLTMFRNEHATLKPGIVAFDNTTDSQLNMTNLFTSTPLWDTIFFNYNTITSLTNSFDGVADLTSGNNYSVHNKIGTNIIESLKVFVSRASAVSFGCPSGTAFIKRTVVTAPNLVAGEEYRVLTSGSPSLGTVGTYFTATGSETGTGTAYSYTRDIVL